MKKIKTRKNQIILVDDEDFDDLNQYTWCLNNAGYAFRAKHIYNSFKKYSSEGIFMHRLLLNIHHWTKYTKIVVDHINGNILDNRKSNLRSCSIKENVRYKQKLMKTNNSGFMGVSKSVSKSKPWRARIKYNGKEIHLGCFIKKEEAGKAYKLASEKYFGVFSPSINV